MVFIISSETRVLRFNLAHVVSRENETLDVLKYTPDVLNRVSDLGILQ